MALHGALTHRKTRQLASILGIQPCYAIGILEALWHATAEHAPQGNIGRLSNADIAMEMYYTYNPDVLMTALVEAKFLDENKEFRLVVHNWAKRADYNTKRKLLRYNKLIIEDGDLKPVTTRKGTIMKAPEQKTPEQSDDQTPITARTTAATITESLQKQAGIFGAGSTRILIDVCTRELEMGIPPDVLLASMHEAWQKFKTAAPDLEYHWGAEKFFGELHWKNPAGWPWKESSNGANQHNGNKPTNRVSPATQRERESNDAIEAAVAARVGRAPRATHAPIESAKGHPDASSGYHSDVSGGVGSPGDQVRDAKVRRRTLEGVA
jgi:hypothetical protein